MASESPASAGPPVGSPIDWQDVRFVPAIEAVRKECGVTNTDDDAFIAMLLDRCNWDKAKVKQLYARSVARRKELGLAEIREHIIRDKLAVEDFPHHDAVCKVMPIYSAANLEPAASAADGAGTSAVDSNVIGCYEMRYGRGDPKQEADSMPVSPEQFAKYMIYVTQWRWLQCERYAEAHGRLGFWSMIHDLSCPQGFFALWGKARSVFSNYMGPVEEACAGLFPPMVQRILVINVPRLFSPVWAVISRVLPEHHKERIVLLTYAQSTPQELGKYVPQKLMPPHVYTDAVASGSASPDDVGPSPAQPQPPAAAPGVAASPAEAGSSWWDYVPGYGGGSAGGPPAAAAPAEWGIGKDAEWPVP